MAAGKRIGPAEGLRPLVFSNLVGLLYATGLRIGEALKLTLGDVDLKRRVLQVPRSQVQKDSLRPVVGVYRGGPLRFIYKNVAGRPSQRTPTAPIFVGPTGGGVREDRDYDHLPGNRPRDSASAVKKGQRDLASMIFATPLPSTVCWPGIAKGPIFRPSCRYYPLTLATPP